MRLSSELREPGSHPPGADALHAEPEKLSAGRVRGLFDSAVAGPGAAPFAACGADSDRDASGTQSADSGATRAAFQMVAAGLLRAGDGAIAAGEIRAVGAGDFAGVAGGGRSAFHCERWAQRDVAAFATERGVRLGGEHAWRRSGAGAAGEKSAGCVRGRGAAVRSRDR